MTRLAQIPGADHRLGFKHLRSGSSKEIYRVDNDTIAFGFTDFYSVFDVGRAPDAIPHKGAAICKCAVTSFKIAEMIGIPTHFVEQIDETTIRVLEAQIITNRLLTASDENYVVPAEWIKRFNVAGSLKRAFDSGAELPENYGLPAGALPVTGAPLPYPVHQLTTKFEKIDRKMSVEELCNIGGITMKDILEYWSMIDRMDGAVALRVQKAGFHILDGKVEMLMGKGRQKMFGDVLVTPDEDRPCKIVDGEIIHYSKEFLRDIHIASGYKKALDQARDAGLPDPPIPRLSEEQIDEASRRNAEFANAFANAA